jgi:hypothetical protein
MTTIKCLGVEYMVHEAANLFPFMGDDELEVLANDVKARGLIFPIVHRLRRAILPPQNRLSSISTAATTRWLAS